MDPRVAAKRYTRTAVCVVNGAPNTAWDRVAADTDPKDAYYPATPKTKFDKAHVEDTLAFAVRKYTNGEMIQPPRPTGNGGDNRPTIPMSSIVNGIQAGTAREIQDKIYVLGTNMGEGAIQTGGSSRTYNHEKQVFPPGTILAGVVMSKKHDSRARPEHRASCTEEENMYVVPMAFDVKHASFPLLDRMRTHIALEKMHQSGPFFSFSGTTVHAPTLDTDVQRIAHFLLDTLFVSEATANTNVAAVVALGILHKSLGEAIDKGVDISEAGISIDTNDIIDRLNIKFKNLQKAYAEEASGTSSVYSRYIIEPLEKFVMDQIDVKNNASRNVFGVVVAPVTANTMMIPFNFINYSR